MLCRCSGGAAQLSSPERAAAFGARLGRALGPRLRWHRQVCDNLAIALPDATDEQVEACAREVWSSFGATLAECAHLETIVDRKFAEHVEDVVHPGVEVRRGRPFIFVTAHLGNWEVAAATALRIGLPLTVVYSQQGNPIAEWRVQRRRRDLGCRFVAADDSIRPLLNELRAGRAIGLMVDLQVESGEAVPFCGHDTTTTVVPARLALKFGCPLVPVRVERIRLAHLRITAYDPVVPDPAAAPDAQARQMTAEVNALFESWIVARPHEWQCFQNRWPESTRTRVLQARARRRAAFDPASPARATSGCGRSTTSKVL